MLSPLKPLLCRHDFYWSERHKSDRCRRCGKTQTPESDFRERGVSRATVVFDQSEDGRPLISDNAAATSHRPSVNSVTGARPSTKVLKAQASERREALLDLIGRLAVGRQLSYQETIDACLALIEDAHSSDPVVFGVEAPMHFATLHEARKRQAA